MNKLAVAAVMAAAGCVLMAATTAPVIVITPPPVDNATCSISITGLVTRVADGKTYRCYDNDADGTGNWTLIPSPSASAAGTAGAVQFAGSAGAFSYDANLNVTGGILYTPSKIVAQDASTTADSYGNVIALPDNHGLTTAGTGTGPMMAAGTGAIKSGGLGFTDCDNSTTQQVCLFENGINVFNPPNGIATGNYFLETAGDGTVGDYAANVGAMFSPAGSNPTCAAGIYGIYVKNGATSFTKCENGSESAVGTAAGGTGFDSLTSGTNLSAAMTVGTGSSMATSGSGTIVATSLSAALPLASLTDSGTANQCLLSGGGGGDPAWGTCAATAGTAFSAITGGATPNTGQSLLMGAGSSLTVDTGASIILSGTGSVTATKYTGSGSTTNEVDLATAEAAGILPLAKFTDDNVNTVSTKCLLNGGSGADPSWGSCSGGVAATSVVIDGGGTANVDLASEVAGVLPVANGGTGTAFFNVSGPTALHNYVFPNSNSTIPSTATTPQLGSANTFTGINAFNNQTTETLPGNTTGHTNLGYSLTGANVASYEIWQGTLNTTGIVPVFRYQLINTASDPTSLFFDWRVGASSFFSMRASDGLLTGKSMTLSTGLTISAGSIDLSAPPSGRLFNSTYGGGVTSFDIASASSGIYVFPVVSGSPNYISSSVGTGTCVADGISTWSGTTGYKTKCTAAASANQFKIDNASGVMYVNTIWPASPPTLSVASIGDQWNGAIYSNLNINPHGELTLQPQDAGKNINLTANATGVVNITGTIVHVGSFAQGTCVTTTSAGTITIDDCNVIVLTGGTAITTINTCDTAAENISRELTIIWGVGATFDVTDGSNLKLNGNFTTAVADSTLKLICNGTNWVEISRSVN
jgi:hypothetical protein